MNYARAAKGPMTHAVLLREIDWQSEVELGRHLDATEKAVLYARFPPDLVVSRIDQVWNFLKRCNICNFSISSMDMAC